MTDAERIGTLRARCLSRKGGWGWDRTLAWAEALRTSEGEPWQVRRGLADRAKLRDIRLEVDDCEILMGRLSHRQNRTGGPDYDAATALLAAHPDPGGQGGHCEVDRSRAFTEGLDALRTSLEADAAAAAGDRAAALRSFAYAVEGLSNLIDHAADVAATASADAPAPRRDELAAMADCCRHVAHRPPRGFRDAIQLLWFIDMALYLADGAGLVGAGHMDRTLRTFYEADRAAGRLTREEALLLIEQLYLLINEFVPDGLAVPVMVGGRDAAGEDVTNELSHLCLEALRRTALVYPTVGVCWHEGTPRTLTDLAVELIAAGYSTPAFFGDETIQRGLRDLGMPPDEACDYINSTCVEITPVGSSNVWVASPYFNTCGLLLEEIAARAADPTPPADFDAFLEGYRARLADRIADAAADQNRARDNRQKHGGRPLQSVFTRDCIARARDIDDGGARYNWVECSFVGLANLADSLAVIREEAFGGGLTFADLQRVLASDFADAEPIRRRFLNKHPKYGNGDAAADDLVRTAVAFAGEACARHRMHPDDSPFVPGAFVWIMHERLGQETGATPDGRRAGEPFADGCGPAQGRERSGPTAAGPSTPPSDQAPPPGGSAFNMKSSRAVLNEPGGPDRLRELIVGFLRRGGFETQINVLDPETLLRARAEPEAYRDLVVRIGGYTDYFVRLSPEMQDEVIRRTTYDRVA